MTEGEARDKAIRLFDQCRDECRVVAEAKIALAFAELYLEAYAAGASYALEQADRRWKEFEQRQRVAIRDTGGVH